MASIWPVHDGYELTRGGPWAELPAAEAIALFDLRAEDVLTDQSAPPRFTSQSQELWLAEHKHIIVEFNGDELKPEGWSAGFYRSRVKPNDAVKLLLRRAMAGALGAENIVRIELGATVDSQGEEALHILVVLAPGAVGKLAGDAVLRALTNARKQLQAMGKEMTPIIEYATEAELAEDARP